MPALRTGVVLVRALGLVALPWISAWPRLADCRACASFHTTRLHWAFLSARSGAVQFQLLAAPACTASLGSRGPVPRSLRPPSPRHRSRTHAVRWCRAGSHQHSPFKGRLEGDGHRVRLRRSRNGRRAFSGHKRRRDQGRRRRRDLLSVAPTRKKADGSSVRVREASEYSIDSFQCSDLALLEAPDRIGLGRGGRLGGLFYRGGGGFDGCAAATASKESALTSSPKTPPVANRSVSELPAVAGVLEAAAEVRPLVRHWPRRRVGWA